MIFILLFVAACFGDDSLEPRVPSYHRAQYFLRQASETIAAHITSMEEGIPDLSDHRRHYAIIFHVVYTAAKKQVGCIIQPLDIYYQKYINESASEAISNPQTVITETQELVDRFNLRTAMILDLVKKYCIQGGQRYTCDEDIQRNVNYYLSPFKEQARALLAGGEFAEELFKKHAEFAEVSYNLNALQYIIGAEDRIEGIIEKLSRFLRTLKYDQLKCTT